MHAVLSRIRYIDEIEKSTLDQILIEGLITQTTRAAVKTK